MHKVKFLYNSLVLLLLWLAAMTLAQAQSNRGFVSISGSDGNDCSRPSPCRTFQRAVNATVAGGVVVALDSGEFGPVKITHSITISGDGVEAAITAPADGSGVVIFEDSAPTDTIILRSLKIDGQNSASTGIYITSNALAAVHLENCRISNFSTNGSVGIFIIYTSPNTAGQFFVDNTAIRSCTYGIIIQGQPPLGYAYNPLISIDHSQIENNATGLRLTGAHVTVRKSVIGGSASYGFGVFVGDAAEINLEDSAIVNNQGPGIFAEQGGIARVSNNTITNNASGLNNSSGTIESFGNNTVRGNHGNDLVGTITVITGK